MRDDGLENGERRAKRTFDGKPATYARITPLVTNGGAQNQHFGNSGMFRESNDSFIGAWAVQDGFDIRSLDGIEQLLIEQTWPHDGFELQARPLSARRSLTEEGGLR
ncbi:MAG: hypothetical protein ACLR0P_08080 [Oscillospiraceae bacterium]